MHAQHNFKYKDMKFGPKFLEFVFFVCLLHLGLIIILTRVKKTQATNFQIHVCYREPTSQTRPQNVCRLSRSSPISVHMFSEPPIYMPLWNMDFDVLLNRTILDSAWLEQYSEHFYLLTFTVYHKFSLPIWNDSDFTAKHLLAHYENCQKLFQT